VEFQDWQDAKEQSQATWHARAGMFIMHVYDGMFMMHL
jgi:hypothetical protein